MTSGIGNRVRMRHRTLGSTRWAFFRWFDIPSAVDPEFVYLRRFRVVQTPWFGVYVHWIYETDSDRYPHDHPWKFWSLILRGGYAELVYDSPGADPTPKMWPPGSFHIMPTDHAHQITDISAPLVTLVFTGSRVREWGFWSPNGFIPWRKFDPENTELL